MNLAETLFVVCALGIGAAMIQPTTQEAALGNSYVVAAVVLS